MSTNVRDRSGLEHVSTREAQRARLLDAIALLAGRDGFTSVKVGELAEAARVSRATFYELFENKEECFLAAFDAVASSVLTDVRSAVADGEPSRRDSTPCSDC